MRTLATILILACVLCDRAEARLTVCNRSAGAAQVALGRYNGSDWMSEGWWTITPGACADVITAPLDARYYYLYATDSREGTWDGQKAFCTVGRKFSIVSRARCADRGFDRKGFFQIDTGQKRDWTQSLAD
jgi:uncharacterized membrane protein